ncbi:A-kinase anchor protein 9, partial [Musca vetustissima]|uniref:A-kinase anchor protein 9 n=1 Tax=Musca vetustissima TaxID=27455 RepID=UPI002AB5F0AE
MPKIHITTLLRPRATYKTSTPIPTAATATIHPYLNVTNSQDITSDIVVYAAKPCNANDSEIPNKEPDSSHLVFTEAATATTTPTTINNIELIPTLEFISHTPAASSSSKTLSCEHLQQCLPGCCVAHHEQSPPAEQLLQQHNETAAESRLTFTIEKSAESESEEQKQQQQVANDSPCSLDTIELLQQEVVPTVSLSDTASLSTYFDEPTSSITIDIMEGSQKTTTTTAATTTPATTTSSAQSAAISRSNNTTSQSNVPQRSSTNLLSSLSDEPSDEIEEEIEEALEEISDEQVDSLDSLPGPSKKPQPPHLTPKSEQMFGIDLSDLSSIGNSEKLSSGKSKKSSPSDEGQFKIDDDQLSGGKLAQHFVLEDSDEVSLGLQQDKHEIRSVLQSEERSASLGLEEEEENNPAEQSLSNQSTSHDVSELQEEPVEDPESLVSDGDYPLSLPEGAGGESNKDISKSVPKSDALQSLQSDQEKLESLEKEKQQLKAELDPKMPAENVKPNPVKILEPLTNIVSPAASESSSQKILLKPLARVTATKKASLPELFENPDIKPLSGSSSNYSEKDQSMEEMMASNPSLEITLDDHEISSLNPSYIDNNKTLIDDLLLEQSADKENQDPKEDKSGSLEVSSRKTLEKAESKETSLNYATEDFVKPADFQQVESCGVLVVEPSPPIEIVTDLDESLPDNPEKPLTSTKIDDDLDQTLKTEIGVAKGGNTMMDSTEEEDDEEETDLKLMKCRIMAMRENILSSAELSTSPATVSGDVNSQQPKAMERVSLVEFAKDVLEDITEESERNSLSTQDEQQSLAALASKLEAQAKQNEMECNSNEATSTSNSAVSLNMIQMLEQKVGELQQMLATKDACLASLNMQLENMSRRESSEQLGSVSGRETSSLATNSTEYRTLQEDFGQQTMDIYVELTKRDELIAKLTESLQQSLTIRENLQTESEKLATEVQLLRKQLTDAMDTLKRPSWPRADQESNFGQRISEISMDLVSESDDDFERHYFTDNEEKFSRNSRERQLSMPRQFDYMPNEPEIISTPFNKQIEQFQKYLTPSEVRLFFMVQKKFDDYLCQELEKLRMKSEQELKIVMDQWETEKREKDEEIQRLLLQRQERELKHNQEMEDLRKYFEAKCAELEKQFSDDVFSQKSQRQGLSSPESSDQEQLSLDYKSPSLPRSKETSPRKRYRAELLLSPSHRQMTPGNDGVAEEVTANEGSQLALEITELKTFYQNKIHEIQRSQEENIKKLSDRLKYYESRYPEDEFVTLLSESTTDDQHWPKELILLREKFTAKSQLEIAQLQIKHAEEMSRLKLDYEKQLNRKNKRHSTFDSIRDYEKLLSERDNLRELSNAFRQVLAELLKCLNNCENELTEALMDEVQRLLTCNRTLEEHNLEDFTLNTTLLNETLNSTRMRLIPDVHNLMEVVEDPSLIEYITQKNNDVSEDFDLKDCLECLRSEASYLLHLSEDLVKKHSVNSGRKDSYSSEREKNDSEQEDGLKLQQNRRFVRGNSLNEQQLPTHHRSSLMGQAQNLISLPPDLNRLYLDNNSSSTTGGVNAAELHFQLTELKNRLIKSENDRLMLQQELDHTISRNSDLGQELQHLRDQLSQLSSINNVEYNEGYGLGSSLVKSPQRLSGSDHSSSGFAQLQEKARNILSTPTQKQTNNDSTAQLLQMIEDFCREGDKVVECSKKDREDLQSQIDTADKQLKATRQFLEEQAIEREQERDEFLKEIDNLKAQLRDKEKERSSYANASEEVEHLENQIRDLSQQLQDSNAKRDKFEVELKASIDKIFVLREIISDLETQVETKALNEHVMGEKVKQLEDYINSQSRSNDALQMEVQSLKGEIEHGYQMRINQLEEKLQNIRPTAEQSLIMDQVVEQLRDIENTLEQKTKVLESLHQSNASSVTSLNCPEDISARGVGPTSLPTNIETPNQGSPIHPSPRQHSWTMEGVQRVVDKLSKHSRVEEAAVKRIRDLEMQVNQMRNNCVELQVERESLQERMSEQTQRISALQSRLEEQRQRAEELQRANTSDLNIRIHDLQNELQTVRETLTNRDKQIATMKQQLEKSKMVIDRLEAELAVEHQPDRSAIERLENELKLKQVENQKLKDKIKNEMINKLALPDLMETMLADKNEEIDHLKEQLESKEKELQNVLDSSNQASSTSLGLLGKKPEEVGGSKLSARTLSDIVSISEFDEPDVVRRAMGANTSSPLLLPEGSGGFLQHTMDTTKGAVANLTHKRTEDLTGFATLHQVNTFDHPHYFQDPNILLGSAQSGASNTPTLVPRQINFSEFTEDSKLKTPSNYQSPRQEKETSSEELISSQLRLNNLQDELEQCRRELEEFKENSEKIRDLERQLTDKCLEIEELQREQEKWQKERSDLLTKHDKNLKNLQESEEVFKRRIQELETTILKNTEKEVQERESLRKELRAISEAHEQCKYTAKDNENRKKEIENFNLEIKAKDERLLTLSTKLSIAEDKIADLQRQIVNLEREVEKWKQQSSDNSSRQFSVDEIAQQVEKELNYSAQLDSNILKAIESEEENNLDRSHVEKNVGLEAPGTTDDENFTGERDLLNQLEALRAQIAVERDHADELRRELMEEKQHSQEVQEQDVLIIEAMRKRLESALAQEDELHKHLDIERERCELLQTQLTTLQRTDSRRNSSLLKSPTESPRKSPRSLSDFESELAERLKSEIKLLTAQNERERERSADLQRNCERERSRYEKELAERIEYCDKLKREMDKVARDKENAELEIDHLQERLTLQTQEIESLEARIGSLQAAETRRFTRKEQQQKENAQLMAEMKELKNQLALLELEKETMNKTITQLRYDIERSAQRETKLAEALANANAQLAAREGTTSVPEQFLQKMKEINSLLAENTQENKQMAETVQYLVEERRQLQRKCEELETQLAGGASGSGGANLQELEERCNHLLGRYLRVDSHRKALVYQKRYLKISLQNYQDSEEKALAALNGGEMIQQPARPKKKLFKTVAMAIIAIQRMKYISRIWRTGKRIVSKSVFTITQQKRVQAPTISSPIITSSSANGQQQQQQQQHQQQLVQHNNGHLSPHIGNYNTQKILDRPLAPLKTPSLLNGGGGNKTPLSGASTASVGAATTAFEWPK